jgi:glycine cleavage system H protein
VNSDPYGQGWMVVIEVDEPDAVEQLLTAGDYDKITESA